MSKKIKFWNGTKWTDAIDIPTIDTSKIEEISKIPVVEHEEKFDHDLLHDPKTLGSFQVDEAGMKDGMFLKFDGDKLKYQNIRNLFPQQISGGGGDTSVFLKQDGTRPLTANWDVGAFEITTQNVLVDDEVYGVGWNGSVEVPTKNALYDKLELFAAGTGIDHGGLTGLSDDDHTQYLLANGTRGLTANWDAGSFKITVQDVAIDSMTAGSVLFSGAGGLVSQDNDKLFWNDTDKELYIGNKSAVSADIQLSADGSSVFNFNKNDSDFIVSSIGEENMLFVDASANRVGIGTTDSVPTARLDISEESATTVTLNFSSQLDSADSYISQIRNRAKSDFASDVVYMQERVQIVDPTISQEDGRWLIEPTIAGSTVELIRADNAGVTINETGGDYDFRVEGDTDTDLLHVNAGTDTVQIGKLNINGAFTFPTADGTSSQVLQTDGSGNLSFATVASGGGAEWTDTGSVLHPNEETVDNVVIGGTTVAGADISLGVGGAAVFNEQGADSDFRVEGDTKTNLFFVDASTDRIGINESAPDSMLEIVTGSSTEKGLTIKESASQSANSLIINDSADAESLAYTPDGNLRIGGYDLTESASKGLFLARLERDASPGTTVGYIEYVTPGSTNGGVRIRDGVTTTKTVDYGGSGSHARIIGDESGTANDWYLEIDGLNGRPHIAFYSDNYNTKESIIGIAGSASNIINNTAQDDGAWRVRDGNSIIFSTDAGTTDHFKIGPQGEMTVKTETNIGHQAVVLDQNDVDEPFIDFQGQAAADTTSPISTNTTSGATTHHIQIEINGVKAWVAASTTNPS